MNINTNYITSIAAAKQLAEVLGLDIKRVSKITVTLEVGKAVRVNVEYFATRNDITCLRDVLSGLGEDK